MPRFDRVCIVDIGEPGGAGLEIKDLRVQFRVTKSAKPDANTMEVTISNLSAASRGRIKEVNQVVIVKAGYREEGPPVIVGVGKITRVTHAIAPPDVTTVIEAADGLQEMRETRGSVSYAPGTDSDVVLADLAKRLGLPIRELTVSNKPYPHGFAHAGRIRDALHTVTDRVGAEWSIQNGELQVLPRRQPAKAQAVVLSAATGLLATPEPLADAGDEVTGESDTEKKAARGRSLKEGCVVRSLLLPELEPGRRVQVESELVKGFFRVESVTHSGDTHGQDWQTEAELLA